jgi:hypothetical protein
MGEPIQVPDLKPLRTHGDAGNPGVAVMVPEVLTWQLIKEGLQE